MRLKPPTLVEDYEHIYSGDDAWDHDAPDFEQLWIEASESGVWDQVPVRPGRTPVVWKLRHLRGIVRRRLRDMLADIFRSGGSTMTGALAYHLCRFALTGVVGLVNDRNQPVPERVPTYPETEAWGRADSVTAEFMEWLACIECDGKATNDSLVEELAGVALALMSPSKNS